MIQSRTGRALTMLALATLPIMNAQPVKAASPYDGTWDVNLTCPLTSAGAAAGWDAQFPAQVANGVLQGDKGSSGARGWLRLEGTIQSDGTSLLTVNGLTGHAGYNLGQAPPLTPYRFNGAAHFDMTSGTGTYGPRPCKLLFVKR